VASPETFFSPPRPGDIVWCHFPQDTALVPGPKPRPALVVRVGEIQAQPAVAVAYGTSQRVGELHPGEFAITRADQEAFALAGLSYDTKFDLSNIVELPYSTLWFTVPPGAPHGQSPKMGLLHPTIVRRATAANRAVAKKK
jgi:PemK-like, MazF-like toxin of type II toxin-antitoxin system